MNVLIVGEGTNEEAALPVLVHRVLGQPVESHTFMAVRDPARARVHGRGRGMFKVAIRWLETARREGFDALIFLVDEDGDTKRNAQIKDAQEYQSITSLPRACGLAIPTFDAWFLADEKALSKCLQCQFQRQPDPEHNARAKESFEDLRHQSDRSDSRSALYKELMGLIDLTLLADRCPKGFGTFANCLETLSS